MTLGPTPKQRVRRERAHRAKALTTPEVQDIFRMAQDRALKALRESTTPEAAWNARSLLLGHDEMVGLLWLVGQDERNVAREISQEEARAAGEAAQAESGRQHEEYLQRAQEARAKGEVNDG